MGNYCSVRDVRLALTPRADSTNTVETAAGLPDWQIEDAIAEAEGVVDSFIATRYTITTVEVEETDPENPLTTWVWVVAPSPLRGWTRDIAAFLAALTFRKNKDLGEDDPIRLRYNHVMMMLKDVRDRKMDLTLPAADGGDDQGVHVENLYDGKMFEFEDVGLGYEGRSAQYYAPLRRW